MHRKIRLILFVLSITASLPAIGWTAAQVTLAWDPCNESDIIGYRVYAREEGERYNYAHPEWQGEQAQCTLPGFDEHESYYFVVRALDGDGNESGDSNEVYWNPGGNSDASLNGDADGGGGGSSCFIETLI
jgi:hypothetical protein